MISFYFEENIYISFRNAQEARLGKLAQAPCSQWMSERSNSGLILDIFSCVFKNFIITESTGHLHNIILVKACLEFFPGLLII